MKCRADAVAAAGFTNHSSQPDAGRRRGRNPLQVKKPPKRQLRARPSDWPRPNPLALRKRVHRGPRRAHREASAPGKPGKRCDFTPRGGSADPPPALRPPEGKKGKGQSVPPGALHLSPLGAKARPARTPNPAVENPRFPPQPPPRLKSFPDALCGPTPEAFRAPSPSQ